MVASRAMIDATPDEIAQDMVVRMEALAADSEWAQIERLVVKLKSAVLDIPENERHAAIIAIGRRIERLQTMALFSRKNVKDRLSDIRRGQVATRAYGQPREAGNNASLR